MGGIQRLGRTAGKRFAMVPLRAQAFDDESYRGIALLNRWVGSVQNEHGPGTTGALGNSYNGRPFVGRGFIRKYLALIPAFACGTWCDQLQGPRSRWFVGRP